jgi:hypothetical protein
MPDRPSEFRACKLRPFLTPLRKETASSPDGKEHQAWRFRPSIALTGTSFDEMVRNFELQRDKEFALHVCADHPRGKNTTSE